MKCSDPQFIIPLIFVLTLLVIAYCLYDAVAHADVLPVDAGRVEDNDAGTDGGADPVTARVDENIKTFIARAPRHPAHKTEYRRKLTILMIAKAIEYDLPVSVVTAVVQRESRYDVRTPRGSRGEIGVMQVHPSTARRFGCEMRTVEGQLDCGCKVLRYGWDKCGTLAGALSVYGSKRGICKPKKNSRLEAAVNGRLKLIKKHEGE